MSALPPQKRTSMQVAFSAWSAQMLPRVAFPCLTALAIASSLGARAGDFVFVAGMQVIDPATNTLVQDPHARIRQAFLNIRLIAQSEGASLQDCVRLTVYVSDLHRFAPLVDKAQAEL